MPKLQIQFDTAAATLYAIVRNADGQAWNGSAFENYVTANLGTYDVALTEQGTASRHYVADFPAAIAAGVYGVTVFEQVGGSPAETDTPLTGGMIDWDGTAFVPLSTIQGRLPAALGANGNMKADVRDYNGTAGTFASGRPEVNTTHAAGTAVQAASGRFQVDVEMWNGTAVPAEHTAGYPIVTVKDGTGTGEINTNAGKVVGVELVDTLTTYTGNTPQTGDSFARIGAAGASLTDLGGMSTTMKAQVQQEAEDAIVAHRLDELLNADSDIDGAAPPTVGSVFHELLSKSTGSFTFDQTTDSLEALRDRGDAAWVTATGFSTHSAADVWAVATRTVSAATNITSTGAAVPITAGGLVSADMTAVSTDATAADNLETMLDGTGGQNLTLGRLVISTGDLSPAVSISQTSGFGVHAVQVTSTAGDGLRIAGGGTGSGARIVGGSTNGSGMYIVAGGGNAGGLVCDGFGTEPGFYCGNTGTGAGAKFDGGTVSGPGISVVSHAGDGLSVTPTAGNGITVTANGTSKHGAIITGGTAGTSDGLRIDAGTGGVDVRADITGDITGTITTVTNLTNLPAITTDWLTAAGVSSAAANKIADHTLRRNMSNVEASSNGDTLALSSVYGMVQQAQESSVATTTLTVYRVDGSTVLGTRTLVLNASADPITGVS